MRTRLLSFENTAKLNSQLEAESAVRLRETYASAESEYGGLKLPFSNGAQYSAPPRLVPRRRAPRRPRRLRPPRRPHEGRLARGADAVGRGEADGADAADDEAPGVRKRRAGAAVSVCVT